MKESEIRPEHLFEEYLTLSRKDIPNYFSEVINTDIPKIPCVACGHEEAEHAFIKNMFSYAQCNICNTLYVDKRPDEKSYDSFYCDSPSSKYWAESFFPEVCESRRKKIFEPRVNKISDIVGSKEMDKRHRLCDVGGGYGLFADEWIRVNPNANVTIIEPGQYLANECREKGFDVLECKLENVPVSNYNKYDIVTCFEVIENAYDPLEFVSSIYSITKPGGITIITGLGVEGFDIQVLWERSKSISPPHHINFMSVKGFHRLFERAGFKNIQVTTPGALDLDIVANHLSSYPDDLKLLSRFEKLCFDRGGEFTTQFQRLLAENNLSSHCWIIAEK